jgi:hypothetical protein
MPSPRALALFLLKAGGTAALSFLTWRKLPPGALASGWGGIHWGAACGSMGAFVAGMALLEAWRMKLAGDQALGPGLRGGGPGPRYLEWLFLYVETRPWIYLLPATLAAEGILWHRLGRRGVPAGTGGRILLSVRLWGLGAWALLEAWSLHAEPGLGVLFGSLPPWAAQAPCWGLLALGAALAALVALPSWKRAPVALLLALAAALWAVLCAGWASRAAGIPLGAGAATGAITFLNFALVLPLSLGGLGLQEALLLTLLAPWGFPPAAILAFSLILHLQRVAMALLGLCAWWLPPFPFLSPKKTR